METIFGQAGTYYEVVTTTCAVLASKNVYPALFLYKIILLTQLAQLNRKWRVGATVGKQRVH